jgi:hypothetical protein
MSTGEHWRALECSPVLSSALQCSPELSSALQCSPEPSSDLESTGEHWRALDKNEEETTRERTGIGCEIGGGSCLEDSGSSLLKLSPLLLSYLPFFFLLSF